MNNVILLPVFTKSKSKAGQLSPFVESSPQSIAEMEADCMNEIPFIV